MPNPYQILLTLAVCFIGVLNAWFLFMLNDIKGDLKELRSWTLADIRERYKDKHLRPAPDRHPKRLEENAR